MRANPIHFASVVLLLGCAGLSLFTPTAAAANEQEGVPYDIGRSIAATHRAILNVANSIQRASSEKAKAGLTELRKAVVRNRAARLALGKKHSAAAMYLTLEARRVASGTWRLLGLDTPYGKSVTEEEAAQPANAGKEADEAITDAERLVPDVGELSKLLPEIDPE